MMDRSPAILLVEDDPTLRDLVSLALRQNFASYQVITARDGLEALKTLEACRPVLVVLDILLPQLNGLELIRRLKNHMKGKADYPADNPAAIPIVTTSLGYQEIVEQAKAAGAKDFIIKPYDVNVLTQRIRKALDET